MRLLRPAHCLALVGCALGGLMAGCGAEGTEAPRVDIPDASCPTVDEHLEQSLVVLERGDAAPLAATLELLEDTRPEAAQGLLGGLLEIIGELWRSGLREDIGLLESLDELLVGLTPLLTAIVDYLATEGPVQTEALETVIGLIDTCPSGAVTDIAAMLVERPELLRALGELVEDPLVISIIEGLTDEDTGQSGREGFVALLRTVIRALNNPTFVFSDLTALIDPFFDLDAPPFDALLAELELLLVDDNLADIRALTVCLQDDIVLASGNTGTEAVAALLFDLLTDDTIRLGERLTELGPALEVLDDPAARGAVEAVVARLQSDEALRDALKPGVRFLLRPENATGSLQSIGALIEAGVLSEVLDLLTGILEPCGDAPPEGQ